MTSDGKLFALEDFHRNKKLSMDYFWEKTFQKIGLLWSLEPADSAFFARDLFLKNNFRKILIPGVGYGRNAKPFIENGFEVTGIEISETAIRLARQNGLDFSVHHGSVTQMPFDDSVYDGIYCYALIHLLNQNERRQFLKNCYNQLRECGIMVFIVGSTEFDLHGKGKLIGKNRFRIEKGLDVFFYDSISVKREFGKFGLVEYRKIDEPVKHIESEEPMKFFQVVCRKS